MLSLMIFILKSFHNYSSTSNYIENLIPCECEVKFGVDHKCRSFLCYKYCFNNQIFFCMYIIFLIFLIYNILIVEIKIKIKKTKKLKKGSKNALKNKFKNIFLVN